MRPISFTTAHVELILARRKSQTRRAITVPRNNCSSEHIHRWDKSWVDPGGTIFGRGPYLKLAFEWSEGPDQGSEGAERIYCPYGYPPDRLWVKESWLREGTRMSSRFMPRNMCRLEIELVSVRCERLQQLSVADAIAEGARSGEHYRLIWDELNLHRGCGWDTNPWVWVLEFKRVG